MEMFNDFNLSGSFLNAEMGKIKRISAFQWRSEATTPQSSQMKWTTSHVKKYNLTNLLVNP